MLEEPKLLQGKRFVDLFAGIGGFHYALSSFGAEMVFASEWDKDCADVYETNFGVRPYGDITKIAEEKIPVHDILCAGFPCQPFSIAGNQLGFNDVRGTLFFDVARIIKAKQPKIVFLENVKNFETHNNGHTLQTVKTVLEALGYLVFYKVLDASDFGVPHSRKRIYILGFRNDANIVDFRFPNARPLNRHVEDLLEPDQETVQYVIHRNDISALKDACHYDSKPIRIGTVNKGGQGERIYSTKGTSITLSAYGGGVGAKTGLYYVNGVIRKLSPRECARLQGFPETFIIPANKNIAYKQFGNSVVIDVLQSIIGEICNNKEVFQWL